MKKFFVIVLTLLLALSLVACVREDTDSGVYSQGRLYFSGTKNTALLVEQSGRLIWLYSEQEKAFEGFDSGDLVKVEHGICMESYPEQTYVTSVELIEDGDLQSFTDEEWERLSGVFAEPPER